MQEVIVQSAFVNAGIFKVESVQLISLHSRISFKNCVCLHKNYNN